MRDFDSTRSHRPTRRAPRRRRGLGCLGRTFLLTLILLTVFVFAGIAVAAALISSNLSAELAEDVARLDDVRNRETFQTSLIVDRNGQELWEIFGEGNRTVVTLDQIPQQLINATIAVEDDTFYTNRGFDEPSLIAAVIANLRNPDDRPLGGSTITQQLVRHVAFDYEERVSVSYRRKFKELFLAWRMTQDFSKDEILSLYLNEIYYGNLAYGVQAAARTYFDKPVSALTLGEATLLAALPQSPVALDPYSNFEGAQARQWFVLTKMVEEGMITVDEANAAYLEQLTLAPLSVSLQAPHFAIWVRQQLETQFGTELVANGGLRVTTTLDLRVQRLAEQFVRARLAELAGQNVTNASVVVLRPGSGEIVALVGSADYRDEAIAGNVNIALTPQQPGSTFKPLVYAAALQPAAEGGAPLWQPAELLWDVPVDLPQPDGSVYTPVNYDGRFHGPLRLREALANSYNVPAILLGQSLGVPRLLETARAFGIQSLGDDAAQYGVSLALGGGEVTPLEMTSAYAVFATGGVYVPPVTILRVENSRGELLYQQPAAVPQRVIDPRVAYLISDFLDDDAARVPAMGANNVLALPFPAAAKTGTTNDFRDNWTIGYTQEVVVTVWMGNADNTPMQDVSGLSGAAPLWSDLMQTIYGTPELALDLPAPAGFTPPQGLTRVAVCTLESVRVQAEQCDLAASAWLLDVPPAADVTPTPTPANPLLTIETLEPAVLRLLAAPLPQPAGSTSAATYCRMGEGRWPAQTGRYLFLQPPRNPESLPAAQQWAQAAGAALLPAVLCQQDGAGAPPPGPPATTAPGNTPAPTAPPVVIVQPTQPPPQPTPTVALQPTVAAVPTTAPAGQPVEITSPAANTPLRGNVPIIGSALFDTSQVQYYKVELRRVDQGDRWVTLGDTHSQPVRNGVLETLYADALVNAADWGPGRYEIRLLLITWDGNYAQPPVVVPVQLVGG